MGGSVDQRELLAMRLANQRIHRTTDSTADNAAAVVRHLLAVQAQDLPQAVWALGLRSGDTRAAVEAALENGDVVRSWSMRGTLHFLDPHDLRWMLRISGPRMLAQFGTRRHELGLDQRTLDRAREVALAVLSGGQRLGRAEFQRELEEAGIPITGQRGYHLILHLAITAVVVWGPPLAGQQALVLIDEWAPDAGESLPRPDALKRFLMRYLDGHAPATIRDFAWWAKVTLTDARTALDAVRAELIEIHCADQSYFITGPAEQAVRSADPISVPVHALPGFDEYLLGYQDRSQPLPADIARLVVPGKNGVFLPTIVAGDQVVGTWRRIVRRDRVVVTAQPFVPLDDTVRHAFSEAVERYGEFLELPATLVWSDRPPLGLQ
ncbi:MULTISPECIES: winged helix DNA-binding domain-containing protein [Cryobacterium]|uniref:Winged helix DNA-binding domain-containing protein n=1 Tax=Cryobacterium breve TaxID=1259258 RepID=A0ABY2J1F8_9MICO|nr:MULTISPECIES: winged helix DNA-binding domain-containing protein [Cryobacterium]TFC96825.1 winged helix DNA-binding domain-containing protein [Cryobacterium sp. TmT3-12]TFC97379.1 winged helix DNA-binding domain-containing protein [Cryobacterium breve]